MKSEKEEKTLEECTFSPVIYSRVPHPMQKTKAKELHNMSQHRSTSGTSINSTYAQPDSIFRTYNGSYTSLTPCQVVVSFKSGCDIANFMSRAR